MTRRPNQRQPGIDALKGLACSLIVGHHLAFYGPMSDVLYPYLEELIDWLYDYGRMAVQAFLVVGGFLAAGSLAPQGVAVFASPWALIWRRYRRLVRPYAVALGVSVLVSAMVRPWFDHPSVSADPTLLQFLAHLALLHDVFEHEALSAGVWYVAIDLQLFALAALMLGLTRRLGRRWLEAPLQLMSPAIGGVLVLAVSSLFFFNRQPELDHTGLYFFGAYALGMLAFWMARMPRRGAGLLLIGVLVGLAVMLDFRSRLLVALAVAAGLVWLQPGQPAGASGVAGFQPWGWLLRPLARLGEMSYSVFLIHFPVCLLVNAVVTYFWPTQVLANALGLLAAFALSLWAGQGLYRGVEARRGSWLGLLKARFIRLVT